MGALLLLGHNGFNLMSFLNPELTAQPRLVKVAREKWQQFENRSSFAMNEAFDTIKLHLVAAKYMPVFHKQKKKVSIPRPQPAKEKRAKIKLPGLTGITRISDSHGNITSLAVIDGECLGEGERVVGFVLQKISEEGIVLTRGGTSWFIPAPKVPFSLDQGG